MSEPERPLGSSYQVSRRSVLRAAAWSAPVVGLATVAPAAAAASIEIHVPPVPPVEVPVPHLTVPPSGVIPSGVPPGGVPTIIVPPPSVPPKPINVPPSPIPGRTIKVPLPDLPVPKAQAATSGPAESTATPAVP